MARKFLTAIDLSKNELQNAAIQNLASAPAAPVKGQLYYDTTGNILYWYNGTAWVAASGSTVTYGSVPAETTFGISKNDGVATSVARSDHTHGSPLHDAAAHANVPLNALLTATGAYSMGGSNITNVGTPANPGDAANKSYVDNSVAGLNWKDSVLAATTAQVALSGASVVIDGVTMGNGSTILVKNQTLPAENGIYTVNVGAWTRRSDMDLNAEVPNAAVWVEQGTVNADTAWVCTNDNTVSLGTTAIVWVQFAGGGTVTAGAGMTQAGNTLNVIAADASITVAADSISRAALSGDVSASAGSNSLSIGLNAVTNAKLADMPTMTIKGNNAGATGDPLDLSGSQVATIIGSNFMRRISNGCAAALTTVLNHGYNTNDVMVTVYRTATPFDTVEVDVERTTVNSVTVRFAVAPAANEYTILVSG